MRSSDHKHQTGVKKFILTKLHGKFVSETKDDYCFEVHIRGVRFKDFFPKSCSWYTEGNDYIEVHKWLAVKKGFVHEAKTDIT